MRNAPRHATTAPKRLVADAAAANTASKLGSTASIAALATASRQGAAAPDPFGPLGISTGAALAATAAGHAPRQLGSQRPARTAADAVVQARPLELTGDQLAGFAVPTTQPGSPSSAGAAAAGIAAMALLGLLGILSFGSQRLGAVVWLRPTSAPASPFLALPERPG